MKNKKYSRGGQLVSRIIALGAILIFMLIYNNCRGQNQPKLIDMKSNLYYSARVYQNNNTVETVSDNNVFHKLITLKDLLDYEKEINTITVGYEFIQYEGNYSEITVATVQSLYFTCEKEHTPVNNKNWIYGDFAERDNPYDYEGYFLKGGNYEVNIEYDTIIPIKIKQVPTLSGFIKYLKKK